jgi:SHAQKYF class myb-like DNA-binding protein
MDNLDDPNEAKETDTSSNEKKALEQGKNTTAASRVTQGDIMRAVELEPRGVQQEGMSEPHFISKHVVSQHLNAASSSHNKCVDHIKVTHHHYPDATSDTDTEASDSITKKARHFKMGSAPSETPPVPHLQGIPPTVTGPEMLSSSVDKKEEGVNTSIDTEEVDQDDDVSQESDASAAEVTDSKKGSKRKRSQQLKRDPTNGRWTPQEHQSFLEGLKVFGREWKKVAARIPTRTSAQIRSHAQKYFSKMQREESILLQDQSPSIFPSSPISYPSVPVIPDQGHLPSSMQRSVDRILANPHEVQQEVEGTLRSLRERYRQLQMQLEQSQRRQDGRAPSPNPTDQIVDTRADHSQLGLGPRPIDRRKDMIEEFNRRSDATHQRHFPSDDISSVSSTVSEALVSRELASEEWIALHVLGGTLPRSASHQELPEAESTNEGPGTALLESPASPRITQRGDSPDATRKHLTGEGNDPHDDEDHRMHE